MHQRLGGASTYHLPRPTKWRAIGTAH